MKRRVIPFSKRRPEIRPQRSTKLSMEEEKSAHPNQQQRREETGSWAESSLRVTSKRNRNRRIIVVHHRICHRYWLRLKHKPGLLDGSAHRRVNRTHMFSYGLTNSLRLGREPSYALSRGRDLRRKLFQMRFHPAHPAVDIVEMQFKLKAIQLQPQQSFIQLVLRQRGGLRLHTVIIQRTGYSIFYSLIDFRYRRGRSIRLKRLLCALQRWRRLRRRNRRTRELLRRWGLHLRRGSERAFSVIVLHNRTLNILACNHPRKTVDLLLQTAIHGSHCRAGNLMNDDLQHLLIGELAAFPTTEPACKRPEVHRELSIFHKLLHESAKVIRRSKAHAMHVAHRTELSHVQCNRIFIDFYRGNHADLDANLPVQAVRTHSRRHLKLCHTHTAAVSTFRTPNSFQYNGRGTFPEGIQA